MTRRQISIIVLLVTVLSEIVFYVSVGGDRLVYTFLIGCALLAVMYADMKAMLMMMFIACGAIIFCVFALGINVIGLEYEFMDEIYNIMGVVMLYIIIYLIYKYTVGTLARARNEAEEANKSKSDFLATMSHEIRTPLNAIIGVAQIQLQKGDLPSDYTAALEKIHNSGNNLLGIINDILDMSKIETGYLELNPVEYDTPSLINDTVLLNIIRIGSKPIEFILDINENLPSRLYGDEIRIKQILNNLLSNAIKYTEEGFLKMTVSHTFENGDTLLQFAVSDTGQGMRPEDTKRLFSEYQRFNAAANRTTEGTGLGLNITKKLVEMMNGTIEAESEYGKGSVFTVKIRQKAVECPAIGPELAHRLRNFIYSADKQADKIKAAPNPMPYGSVLVVDDVETNLYVAEGLLAPYMLKVETADSGPAAIEKVKNGNAYDLIFMDHMMPKMDGIETAGKLRELGYAGIIVALTANALVGNDEMFMQKGFDGFISKPIDIRQLDTALNRFIRDRYPEEAKKYKPTSMTAQAGINEANPKLLQIFCSDAKKAIITLRETAGSDIKLFVTTAHAIKSALANVGEHEVSDLASALENAGQNGDTAYITANTQRIIEKLEALIHKFTPSEAVTEAADVTEDTLYLAEQLEIVRTACKGYDDTAAYAALERLKEKLWKPETAAVLEQIYDMLYLFSDFDGAAEVCGVVFKNYYQCDKG